MDGQLIAWSCNGSHAHTIRGFNVKIEVFFQACKSTHSARFLVQLAAQNQGQVDDRLNIDQVDTLQLQNVHFAYPARPEVKVLQGVSLTIQKAS